MAITGDYNLYQYQQPVFGALTSQGNAKAIRPENYSQATQGVPNTTPQVVNFGIPTTTDMERASEFLASNIGFSGTQGINKTTNPYAAKGADWEGFKTPAFNGSGELIPVLKGREDEIYGFELMA